MPIIPAPIWTHNDQLLKVAIASAQAFIMAYNSEEEYRSEVACVHKDNKVHYHDSVEAMHQATLKALSNLHETTGLASKLRQAEVDDWNKRPL